MVKVLIIGGGLGGPALAQYLKAKNVDFEIFERDESASSRSQGWSLSLQGRVPNLISEIMPSSALPIESVRVAAELGFSKTDNGAFFQPSSATPKFLMNDETGLSMPRANRSRLRKWLTTDLNVSWNKHYMSHEVGQDGKVTVYFADGSSSIGDMLVGADGIGSHVRVCMSPDDHPRVLPLALVGGELILDAEQAARQRKLGPVLYTVGSGKIFLFVGLRDVAPGAESSQYYWFMACSDPSVPELLQEHWTVKASPSERLAYAKSKLEEHGFDLALREIVDLQPEEQMLPSFFVRDHIPQPSPEGPVTLIGDAAHGMAPFRGQGANNALRDALALGEAISQAVANEKETAFDAAEVVRTYEKDMIPRALAWVLNSRRATENFDFDLTEILGQHEAHGVPVGHA